MNPLYQKILHEFRQSLINYRKSTSVRQFSDLSLTLYRETSRQLADKMQISYSCHDCVEPSCCQAPIHILDIEFVYITEKIQLKNPPISYVTENHENREKELCPMLENKRCSIYANRPSVCMRYIPVHVQPCQQKNTNGVNIELFSMGRQLSAILEDELQQGGIKTAMIDFIASIRTIHPES